MICRVIRLPTTEQVKLRQLHSRRWSADLICKAKKEQDPRKTLGAGNWIFGSFVLQSFQITVVAHP